MKELKDYVRTIPDFPEKGIMFRDITSVLQDADGLHLAIDTMQDLVKDLDFDVVVGAESRGFIFGVLLAEHLGVPFVPIRKPGKLPREVFRQEYDLEYGSDELQIHKDALGADDKVAIIDDLLATGGTAEAACHLVEQSGAEVVGSSFVIELAELEGRKKLGQCAVYSLVTY